jgi:hypothetical protein
VKNAPKPLEGRPTAESAEFPDSVGSTGRLVLLALCLSTLFNMASLPFGYRTPWRLVFDLLLSQSAIEAVPTFYVHLARLAFDWLLPAWIFLILFWAAKLNLRRVRYLSVGAIFWVTLAIGLYLVYWSLPIFMGQRNLPSGASGALSLVFGLYLLPVFLLVAIFSTATAIAELGRLFSSPIGKGSASNLYILAWLASPIVVLIAPLMLAEANPLKLASEERSEFKLQCRTAGPVFKFKPAGPVKSVAYDFIGQRVDGRLALDVVSLNENGAITGYAGSALGQYSKRNNFEFTERRATENYVGKAKINPDLPIHRILRNSHTAFGVDEFSADVLALLEVKSSAFSGSTKAKQGLQVFQLTLTDRRSNRELGVMTYVIDQVNFRACGANLENMISREAFIYDAISQ